MKGSGHEVKGSRVKAKEIWIPEQVRDDTGGWGLRGMLIKYAMKKLFLY